MPRAVNLLHPDEPEVRSATARLWLIAGDPGERPRDTARLRCFGGALSRAPVGCFCHCGSSEADIAIFDPRSWQSGVFVGILFYFMRLEWVLSLPFPSV